MLTAQMEENIPTGGRSRQSGRPQSGDGLGTCLIVARNKNDTSCFILSSMYFLYCTMFKDFVTEIDDYPTSHNLTFVIIGSCSIICLLIEREGTL